MGDRSVDPQLNEVSQLFSRFEAAFTRNDFNTCTNLLSQLKVLLTKFPSLPPSFQKTPNAVQELTITKMKVGETIFSLLEAGMLSGERYEHAAVLSVKTEDQDAFERDFFQLKPSYRYMRCNSTVSSRVPNLLRLLVLDRKAEFHTELELLPASVLENPCIKHAIELEVFHGRCLKSRTECQAESVPHETYVYFMDLLAKTEQPEMEVKNGCVFFQKAKELQLCKEIPSLQLINQTLSYAKELERMV